MSRKSASTPDVQVLLAQNEELRARLQEAEDALRAIRAGEVDALVVESAGGPQIFTLQGVDAESNRFRGELLAQVRDAVIVVDDEQRLTYLNASAERQYGVAAADVIGLPIDRIYETRWPAAEGEGAAFRALCGPGHWHGELTHVTRSGATMQVQTSVTRLCVANGTGPGQIAVIRDITAEHALRIVAQQQELVVKQSETRLKRVIDQLIVFVWIVDLDGWLVECNAAPLQRAGIKAEDVIGKRLWESCWVVHDAAVAQPLREAVQRAAQGETTRFDVRCRFAGGELSMVDLQLAPLRDDAGRIISVIASGVDVQARVAALRDLETSEARAVDAARRLDAERRMLQATLEAAPVGIALADSRGHLLQFNEAGATLLGIAGVADRSRASHTLRSWQHPPGAHGAVPLPPDQWPLREALTQLRTVTNTIDIAPPDGSVRRRTVLMSAAPVLDATGNLLGGVLVQVDMTERVQAEAAMRQAARQKDEFLATLAHELRNPLAPIRTAVELIRQRNPPDEGVQRARATIERQVLHLSRLVDDLVDVSRMTRGTIRLRPERLDLGTVAVAAVESVRSTLEAAGLTLEQHIARPPALVSGDAARLVQCLVNVLNNAVKFTPRGGQVKLRVTQEGPMAVVEVSDTGAGIESSNLERVFDIFMQEHPSGFGGTGLGIGLALTRKLVELHGGTVKAASAGTGHGSAFRIELPLAANTVAGPPLPAAIRVPDGAGARVLVVDDNRDAADLLGEFLAMSGFTSTRAYCGEAAVSAVCQEEPDAVLLDIGLPDIDGYEVCRRIRRLSVAQQPVVIALTGWAQDKDRDRATAAGFNAHLTKPAEPDQVIALLQKLLAAPRVFAQ